MELTKEIQMTLTNDTNIKSVDVTYPNGELVSGFVKELRFIPFNVTLCRHRVPRNENPFHTIDFDFASKIQILYHDGTVKLFE